MTVRTKPPRGYKPTDKGLPHEFTYYTGLTIHNTTQNSLLMTYLRTSKDTVDPDTIEVNPKNSSFVVDAGAVICFDSIVPEIEIKKSYVYDYGAQQTSKLGPLKLQTMKIFGHHKISWEADDPLSGSTVATILEVIKDATKEDVVPVVNGTKLLNASIQEVSTITMTEAAIADYNLTTTNILEGSTEILRALRDTEQYKIIGPKIKTMHAPIREYILSPQRPVHKIYEKRMVPKQAQFADDYVYYGELITLPDKTSDSQICNNAISTTAISHIFIKHDISFIEFNPYFDQRRM